MSAEFPVTLLSVETQGSEGTSLLPEPPKGLVPFLILYLLLLDMGTKALGTLFANTHVTT